MKKYENKEDMRTLNRSTMRNMPPACINCGYRFKPSSSNTQCIHCPLKHKS